MKAVIGVALLAVAPFPRPLIAQTVDRPRVVIGLSVGRMGGTDLWDVARQPILSTVEREVPDTFQLHREIGAGMTFSAHGTYFVNSHFGLTGELTYLGLGATDACTLIHDDGDPSLVGTCQSLNNQSERAAAYALQVGGVVVLSPGAAVHPYLTGLVGMASTPASTVAMVATDVDANGQGSIVIYRDGNWSGQRPTWTVGGGLSTAPNQGLQVRFELRDTWLAQSIVTGSNPTQNGQPPSRSVIKSFPSVWIGVDIVLRRERGRRY